MPWTQTPKELSVSHLNDPDHSVFQLMKIVDLLDVEYYGAQYLHLRYGLINPYSWLHLIRYLLKCRFGDGLPATLYPYRTLTDKKRQALLGALMTILSKIVKQSYLKVGLQLGVGH
jgi:hypothetical protein